MLWRSLLGSSEVEEQLLEAGGPGRREVAQRDAAIERRAADVLGLGADDQAAVAVGAARQPSGVERGHQRRRVACARQRAGAGEQLRTAALRGDAPAPD